MCILCIWIRLWIQTQQLKLMRIHSDPDPKPCSLSSLNTLVYTTFTVHSILCQLSLLSRESKEEYSRVADPDTHGYTLESGSESDPL
jgi:hypothetical protein